MSYQPVESARNIGAPEPASTTSVPSIDQMENYVLTDPSGSQVPIESTPPPMQPDLAAQLLELKQAQGSLIQALGSIREENRELQQRLELERLNRELFAVPQAPVAPPAPALPPELAERAGDPFTVQDVFTQLLPQLNRAIQLTVAEHQAQLVRQTWDVTEAERQRAVQLFPQIQQLPESQQIPVIQRVVREVVRKPTTTAPQPQTAPPTQAQSPAPQPGPSRPVVPLTDTPQTPTPEGIAALNEATLALQEYQEIVQNRRTFKTPHDRERALTAAYERVLRAQGTSMVQQAERPINTERGY